MQQVFANVFRSLFQHKLGDLGSLVLATKLLSADQTTTLALNLLGDPALSIDYQFDSVPQDSIDLAVSGLDMEFISGRHDYASSSSEQSVSVVVANKWKDSAVSVPVEIWRGVPDGSGSVLLNSFTIASLSGHSDTTWTGSIGSFAVGDYDIYATADPDNRLDDPVPTNNVSYRTLHVRDYAPGFPIAASGNRAEVMDAVIGSPRKLEIAAGDSLYSSDGMNLGRVGTGPAGNLFRSEKRYVVSIGLLVGEYQYLKVSEAGGTWQSFFWVPPSVSDIIALDHGRPDSMLVALNGAQYPDRMIRLYTVAGQPKWTRAIGGAAGGTLALSSFAMAAGDITGDGVSDVVYVLNPTTGVGADSLGVIDGKTGSRVWAISTSDEQLERVRVRLVDIENDGALEIVVNSRLGSPVEDRIQCFSASGSLLWQVTGGQAPAPPLLFAPADINHDGVKEIVFACGQRVGIISVSGTSAIVSCEITLTGYRVFNSTPLAIDIDGDDLLEFILFSRVQDHYLNVYSLEMRVYDSDLTLLGSPTVFPWGVNLLGPIDASAGDIDGDGIVEVVFITPDQTLHAVRVGSVTGRGDWTSADGDAMRTGLYEQVIAGSYAEHLAVQGRARVLDDAALSQGLTVTGPADLQVSALDSIVVETSFSLLGSEHDSVRVRIDELASPESYWGGFYFGNGTSRGKVEHAVVTGALTGFEHSSALQITGSRISDVSATGIVSADSLWLVASTVSGASGNGLELGLGTVATIDGSVVENVDGSGLVCDSCSAASKLKNSTIRGSGLHGAYLQRVHGISVESSVFENNASAGIRFESADGLVTQCRSEGNAGGVVCFDHSNPVVEESKVDQNQGGVAAVENSYPIVGYGSIGGRDCITNSTGYHVSNLSSGWIYAHHDYWGSACCKTSKFFGNVSCDSCETAAVCQGAGGMAVSPPAEPVSNSVSPSAFDLVSAAPNPFNPNVRIRFAVPSGGASVQLTVYNVRGQRVAVLQDGVVPPGYHERTWSGVDIRGESVATGVYFVRMESAGFQEVMKIVLLK